MLFYLETWSDVPSIIIHHRFRWNDNNLSDTLHLYDENLALEILTLNVTSEKNGYHVTMVYVVSQQFLLICVHGREFIIVFVCFVFFTLSPTFLCLNEALHLWTARELHEGMHIGRQAFKIQNCRTRIPALHPVCSLSNKKLFGKGNLICRIHFGVKVRERLSVWSHVLCNSNKFYL